MAVLYRQDMDDDFSGVDQGSRYEIAEVTRKICQTIWNLSCLVIFHNGSDNIDISSFGIPQYDWFSPRCNKILWTFGRRLSPEIKEKVANSHLLICNSSSKGSVILEEAVEAVKSTLHNKHSITPGIAAKCFSYLLWLNEKGGGAVDYNWATHASNYWVCDGIIEAGQFDEGWELSAALHQHIRIEDFSSDAVFYYDNAYLAHRWKSAVYTSGSGETTDITSEGGETMDITSKGGETTDITISSTLTSFFLADKGGLCTPLPSEMFQQSERLRVLKLFGCNFSFYSPPFCCCHSLRFLGLDRCKDQLQEEEEKQQKRPIMEFFKSLWVVDISHMDWELDLSQDILDRMATNIREIHVKNGRIWCNNLAWRLLQNLCKLKVIKLLDLYGNNAIHVLPSLCGATGLKNLVLDGCAELDHVGPGLPPSLESFSFDAGAGDDGYKKCKMSCINLAGCEKLVDLRLLGSLPNLEELDLSSTPVKILNLKKEIQVQNLQRIFLMGCVQLRSIIWPEKGMQQLRLLCINTQREVVLGATSRDSLVRQHQEKYCHAHVCVTDIRFLQSLVLTGGEEFRWITAPFKLNLYLSCTSKDDEKNKNNETMGQSSISMTGCAYNDISIEEITTALQFEPEGLHVEIGQEAIDTDVVDTHVLRIIRFMMDKVMSLHVHNSCSITSVIPEHIMSARGEEIGYRALKWCRVEKCPKLDTVFHTNYDIYCFDELEIFWAADLLMARSIWSRGRIVDASDNTSFAKLQAIHLHMCPRLQFVLPLSWNNTLSSLETLHIVSCSDLKQVFPVESDFLKRIATKHPNGMLKFPKLKNLYLHDLSCLQQICEAKIFAPKLETVRLSGCWGLRRLPTTDRSRRDGRLVDVDCQKDWWEKLEWDGLNVGHHPSLYAPRHPAYYKKRFLRTTVLR